MAESKSAALPLGESPICLKDLEKYMDFCCKSIFCRLACDHHLLFIIITANTPYTRRKIPDFWRKSWNIVQWWYLFIRLVWIDISLFLLCCLYHSDIHSQHQHSIVVVLQSMPKFHLIIWVPYCLPERETIFSLYKTIGLSPRGSNLILFEKVMIMPFQVLFAKI